MQVEGDNLRLRDYTTITKEDNLFDVLIHSFSLFSEFVIYAVSGDSLG